MMIAMFFATHWSEIFVAVGIAKALYDAFMKKEWAKVEKIIAEEALPLVGAAMSNKQKRDVVVAAVWDRAPKAWKMIVSTEQIQKMVDFVYQTQVQPLVKREGIEKKTEDDFKNG